MNCNTPLRTVDSGGVLQFIRSWRRLEARDGRSGSADQGQSLARDLELLVGGDDENGDG